MNHVKETPRIVKYGNKIPVQVNSTIPKKVLTSICESGILEGEQNESTSRDGQISVRTNEGSNDIRSKTIDERKVTDRNVGDSPTSETSSNKYTERTTTKNESFRKLKNKRIKPETTSDQ